MTQSPSAAPETPIATSEAACVFEELHSALQAMPIVDEAFDALSRALTLVLDRKTAGLKLKFSGQFSKADYLLGQYHADAQLAYRVNRTRRFLHQRQQKSHDELERYFTPCLSALCAFTALVYEATIPQSLKGVMTDKWPSESERVETDYLRVIVKTVATENFTAEEDETGRQLTISFTGWTEDPETADWSYLKEWLREGTQVNVVRPKRQTDGSLTPELLIYEPDLLIDISNVAACFEDYAHSARVGLLSRLMPQETSEAIVMGNLAGQLLDDELHGAPDNINEAYKKSVKTFFKKQALNLLAVNLSADFHQRGLDQLRHIRHALSEALTKEVSGFDRRRVMLEPTFFSEQLGLQGRMDFLQTDGRLVIEQKAGKGGFPAHDADTPVAQTKHYVQLLLYVTLLRHSALHEEAKEEGKKEQKRLQAFLLYSRYKNSLVAMSYAPRLVFEAFKVRNALAAQDLQLATEGYDLLLNLTPDDFNERHVGGRLWNEWQRPKIERLLHLIQTAPEPDRTYALRLLAFIQTEHLHAKIGTQTKSCSGFAAKWHEALPDKRQAGTILDGLQLCGIEESDEKTPTAIERLELTFTNSLTAAEADFRRGDIVVVYPYAKDTEPDVRRPIVFRGTIEALHTDRVCVSLRAAQTDGEAFRRHKTDLWAIEHDFIDASYSSLYRSVVHFLSSPPLWRNLLMGRTEPTTDFTKQLVSDYGAFNNLMRRVKQARELFLIIGPPGTGKTSYGMADTLEEALTDPAVSVLVTAYTNRAVDEICSKLVERGRQFVRVGSRVGCAEAYRHYLLENLLDKADSLNDFKAIVGDTRIVVGTVTAFNAASTIFKLKHFDLAIIDEASQILEPHLLGLLSATHGDLPAIGKVVMIGDHKQLPAVVQQGIEASAVTEPCLQAIGLTDCRLSLFERLLRRYADRPDVVCMLRHQGRMHHDIAAWPSSRFYASQLTEVPLKHQLAPLTERPTTITSIAQLPGQRRLAFIHVTPPDLHGPEKVNQAEAEVIAELCRAIYDKTKDHFAATATLGVIVPYRAQIAAIRTAIAAFGIAELNDIGIDTVERFQGSQRDYIIYGFTVKRSYQLEFLESHTFVEDGQWIDRKLNVAMTRAREALFMVGNGDLLRQSRVFNDLIDYAKGRQAFFEEKLKD